MLLPEPVTPARITKSFGELAQFFDDRRQTEIGEVRNHVVDAPRHQRQSAALLEQADAEAAFVLADDPGKVNAPFLVEDLALLSGQSSERRAAPCLPG